MVKNLAALQKTGSILGLGRPPGEGNAYPLQHSCLENSTDSGAWWATVHGVEKSQTRLSNFHFLSQLNIGFEGDRGVQL